MGLLLSLAVGHWVSIWELECLQTTFFVGESGAYCISTFFNGHLKPFIGHDILRSWWANGAIICHPEFETRHWQFAHFVWPDSWDSWRIRRTIFGFLIVPQWLYWSISLSNRANCLFKRCANGTLSSQWSFFFIFWSKKIDKFKARSLKGQTIWHHFEATILLSGISIKDCRDSLQPVDSHPLAAENSWWN